ncbi:glycosyltransferase family 4 protein [Candidatus Daviesbacteria bacterium]|nr:glycosyltransferase family 4 protein [Candidatus Daviesbacteria bacterium]
MNIKIAVITESINNHSGARAPLELAKNLSLLGNEIRVYSYNNNLDKTALKELKASKVTASLLSKIRTPFLSRSLPDLRLTKKIWQDKPQVIIFCGSFPSFWGSRLTFIPLIRIYMGTQFGAFKENFLPNTKLSPIQLAINLLTDCFIFLTELLMVYSASYVIAISNYAAVELKRLYNKKANKVIYLGGNHLRHTKPSKFRKISNLISVSRITPYKGLHLLIDSLRDYLIKNNLTFTIVGTKVKANYFKYLKKIAGRGIKFVINPSDKELAKLYEQSDLYISADKYLFFGLPISEVAFFAKPAISLDFGAAKELINNNQTGFIAKNTNELVPLIDKLLKKPSLRVKMGQNAKKRASQLFNWREISLIYLRFIKSIL